MRRNAVILFYDESKWSMAAHYNRRRLLGDASADPSPQPIRAARPASSGSTSPRAAPTAEIQRSRGGGTAGVHHGETDGREKASETDL